MLKRRKFSPEFKRGAVERTRAIGSAVAAGVGHIDDESDKTIFRDGIEFVINCKTGGLT